MKFMRMVYSASITNIRVETRAQEVAGNACTPWLYAADTVEQVHYTTCTVLVWAAVKHHQGPQPFCRTSNEVFCFAFSPADQEAGTHMTAVFQSLHIAVCT